MTLRLLLEYYTSPGENLCVGIARGENRQRYTAPMATADGRVWTLETEVSPGETITYSYFMAGPDGRNRCEWGNPRSLTLPAGCPTLEIHDLWHDRPADRPFYSTAFSDCIFSRPDRRPAEPRPGCVTIVVDAPMVTPERKLLVCGGCEALGDWSPDRAPAMKPGKYPSWHITFERPDSSVEFKFMVAGAEGEPVWESRDNRRLEVSGGSGEAVIVNCPPLANPMPLWRGAGVAVPVFSLRSESSCGIGDFADIAAMADWASATGMTFLQLLPVNDTTSDGSWADSYPYNSISTFALNPVYMRLQEVGELSSRDRREHYAAEARRLNDQAEVDFESVVRVKSAYLRELFAESGKKTTASEAFANFCRRNSLWLEPYAAFCVLRDIHSTTCMDLWGEYAVYNHEAIAAFLDAHKAEADYYRWLQFNLDAQLRRVNAHCHSVGIALKGDIPIGVSRTSVDVWTQPELFNLDQSAGAPPDAFAINGQNWGFPTYNWERMALDGFAWWKARLRKMADYFDAYRIDHLLGFFRIWQIPRSAIHGLLGIFYQSLPLSPDELKYSYDFPVPPSRLAIPSVSDETLDGLFGEDKEYVKATYLMPDGNGGYTLREAFNTQRKIADNFPKGEAEASGNRIYNGLLAIAEEMLFIADTEAPDRWHPRIAGEKTYAYKELSPEEQQRYSAMSHDFFYSRNDSFWREKAMWKLPPLIDSTGMLCCGEDLGMIPACVPSVMEELEILSLKVQRMPDNPALEFADTRAYPYYCVCTTSTHDMGGLRQWWEENPVRTKRFYNNGLGLKGDAPYYAEPWICDRVVTDHLTSPAMLCILPLQDWLAIDGRIRRDDPRNEQINDPANPDNRWNYRMHITLEQLMAEREFNAYIKKKIKASGR